ncbi:DUF5682 family protein [Kitasatospora sp. NBC_01287]|uniref:DUF5682 family protein n=1 Tax=Kitasatospora sp. NBC_01287 TaxID=2903573 RepID=UPI00224F720A|nr:DUF5682 family protein [Kitasatospora sp. NBC_01287]MCX4748564.1 DUF5682 family protein [Kitasatospora sp. NBC_01287]
MTGEVALLGVRHHGPGSARAVGAALAQLRPDAVLIEGPPEADPIIGLAADQEMVPPVALLAHVVDDPARAAFWPFAAFSPEWVAIRHGLAAGVPVRFIDLPAGTAFALSAAAEAGGQEGGQEEGPALDPIARLAAAAGQADPEAWWEDVVEHRLPGDDPLAPFAAVAEAMAVLRDDPVGTPGSPSAAPVGPAGAGEATASPAPAAGRREELREAYMRQQIRAARRAGHRRIAVVCGAWHVPALAARTAAGADRALLTGLPRRARTEITWVPWTHRRLAQRTGYGAGIESPGWYQHLFERPAGAAPGEGGTGLARFLTRAAELLRGADRPVSAAHVIEAVRLAETLAAVRGRPAPGLAEALDAVRSVYCEGSEVALALVRERLVIGDALGRVPAAAPAVPLQRDLTRLQRTLRLRPEAPPTGAAGQELTLDLRGELDAGRSVLLHRLRLLGIDWGTEAGTPGGATGTFKERWRLRWDPEFAVRVVAAAPWGTTVERAAAAKAAASAARAGELAELTGLAETCLVARLPGALPAVLRALADRATLHTDAAELADALPALVRALRYGDVRGTDSGALAEVAHGLAGRLCVALPTACAGLDAERATAMRSRLEAVHGAIGLLRRAEREPGGPPGAGLADRWAAALHELARRGPTGGAATGVPGLLRGRAVRLLLDEGWIEAAEAGRRLGLVLSRAAAPADAAGWIEGFLAGGGALLLHDPRLLALLDSWLTEVPEQTFIDLLPLLRRTFAALEAGVRRGVGAKVAAGRPVLMGRPADAADAAEELDQERADAALPTVLRLLGRAGPPPPLAPTIGQILRQSTHRSAA